MECGGGRRRWDELPPELVADISRCLENPMDVSRMRSVCRPWWMSITRPPHKLSRQFPPRLHVQFSKIAFQEGAESMANATAVYLIRPEANNDQSACCWVVSVQETDTGKLILRHALTHEKLSRKFAASLDLSRCSVTQLSLVYGYSAVCTKCNQMRSTSKTAFAGGSSSTGLIKSSNELRCRDDHLFGFSPTKVVILDLYDIDDFVSFNGQVYAVDTSLNLYVFDSTDLSLREMPVENPPSHYFAVDDQSARLLVSDGDLYVLLEPFWHNTPGYVTLDPPRPWVYKVVLTPNGGCRFQTVHHVGDRVFFANRFDSFTLSVRDLPPSWNSNCLVFPATEVNCSCRCFFKDRRIGIYHIGKRHVTSSDTPIFSFILPTNSAALILLIP